MTAIQLAVTDAQVLACWPALHGLRPHLEPAPFLAQIRDMQAQGYELAFIQPDQHVVAVAGFRYLHQLQAGRVLYLDDLATLPEARGQGYAGQLLDYLHGLAQERRLDGVALDSGFARHSAHRLYVNKGFAINALHFLKEL